jgi:hypothetical protein
MVEISISENMTIFTDLIKIFQFLSGAKFHFKLPLSKFRHLSDFDFMISKNYLKQDYDILYKRIEVHSDSGQMDFYGFIEAIEYIAKRLHKKLFVINKKQCM